MQPNSSPRARIPRALVYIRTHLRDSELTPSLVAHEVGLDLPVFCRAFKVVTGMTCTDYTAVERMQIAKSLLARNDLLVKEVAYRVGFENPNYFSRRFKEVEGRTPTSYRRLNHH